LVCEFDFKFGALQIGRDEKIRLSNDRLNYDDRSQLSLTPLLRGAA